MRIERNEVVAVPTLIRDPKNPDRIVIGEMCVTADRNGNLPPDWMVPKYRETRFDWNAKPEESVKNEVEHFTRELFGFTPDGNRAAQVYVYVSKDILPRFINQDARKAAIEYEVRTHSSWLFTYGWRRS
jgi:hypothetical protein